MDISEKATSSCSRFASVITGEFTEVTYNNYYYDAVSVIHVIEHLPQPLKYIERIKRRTDQMATTLQRCRIEFDRRIVDFIYHGFSWIDTETVLCPSFLYFSVV